MTLMFFLSGLFVPSSLAGKGSWKFLSDRLLRIGLPMALAVIFLAPLAYYPAYRTTAIRPGAYLEHWLALPFWPCGPQWFLGELLAFTILVAAAYQFLGLGSASCPVGGPCGQSSGAVRCRSGDDLRGGLRSPDAGLFAVRMGEHRSHQFQPSRPLHYLVYFLAGVAVGTYGLDRGVLDATGFWRGAGRHG